MMTALTEAEVSERLLIALRQHAPSLMTIAKLTTAVDLEAVCRRVGTLSEDLLDELALEWADRG